jgi:hypothetical protein
MEFFGIKRLLKLVRKKDLVKGIIGWLCLFVEWSVQCVHRLGNEFCVCVCEERKNKKGNLRCNKISLVLFN